MAKQNLAFMYGRVSKNPIISRDEETGEYNYGLLYLDTVRGLRSVDDDVNFVKHDHPLIMSREKEICDKMADWKENDIIFVKGVITSKKLLKPSYCPHCTDENGMATKNDSYGNLLFVTPIYAEKVKEESDKKLAQEDVVLHREISNQVFIYGHVLKEPKLFITKQKVRICQYPIAINRKFTIRTDDPSIKTDWPIVKSYGKQAIDDKARLDVQSEIIVDGFLQSRRTIRRRKCDNCGRLYDWEDNSMEIVPYAVEYIKNYKSDHDIEVETQGTVEEYLQSLFEKDNSSSDDLVEGLLTDDCNS